MPRPDADFDDEIQTHIDMLAERLTRQGMSPDEAVHAARRQFGNAVQLKERRTEMHRWYWLDELMQDVRYALRTVRNDPGFAAVIIFTAALGIGLNTSIFSVIDAVLLRPLPYPNAGRLVEITTVSPRDSVIGVLAGDFQYAGWRDQATVFDGIAAFIRRTFVISEGGATERITGQIVTPGFLRTLRTTPLIGRDFIAADAAPRGGQVALISHALWTTRYGADPSILSRSITLDNKSYAVAGVLPRTFEFPSNKDVSVLLAMPEPSGAPGGVTWFYSVIARMKPGITPKRVESDLAFINRRMASANPAKFANGRADAVTNAVELHEFLVGDVKPALLILSGAVALVLFISCVNIGNLLLARAVVRRKEIALRIALGAGLRRVFRQLMTESVLLALMGGTVGLALAFGGVRLLRATAPAEVPHIEAAHISATVLAFSVVLSFVTGLAFGLVPLRRASHVDPEGELKQNSRSATRGPGQFRIENVLVVSQVALALILVIGAGLLIRTLGGLTSIAPGFRPQHVLSVQFNLPGWRYPSLAKNRAFFDNLLARIRTAPGVESAGVTGAVPYGGFAVAGNLEIEGQTVTPSKRDDVAVDYATDGYFESMGIPLLAGRSFSRFDKADSAPVTLINQTLARRYFPREDPLGKRVRVSGVTGWATVIGITGDVKQLSLVGETHPEIVQLAAQSKSGVNAQNVVIRHTGSEQPLIAFVRAQIAALDPHLPPPEIQTMEEMMAALVASQRFVMRMLTVFAALSITLSALGIYGVLVYSVEQRSREISIRVALGARHASVIRLIMGRGIALTLVGAVIGTCGALLSTVWLKSLLYGVSPHDPTTIGAAALLLTAVAIAASWLPARRAVAVDPVQGLRSE